MKIKLFLHWLNILAVFLFLSCKQQNKQYEKIENKPAVVFKGNVEAQKEELYKGKIFFSGDELNNYSFIKSDELNKDDSLTYSIYKSINGDEFVMSIEKLLSNNDKEKYEIIDIFKFKNYSSENTQIQLQQKNNDYHVLLQQYGKSLKTWTFKQNNKLNAINTIWSGEYNGKFLRIKDEGDPRAWGQIHLNINGKNAKLKIDSYVENVSKDLNIVSESNEELKLKDMATNKGLIFTKRNNIYLLRGDLIDTIVGFKEEYELKK